MPGGGRGGGRGGDAPSLTQRFNELERIVLSLRGGGKGGGGGGGKGKAEGGAPGRARGAGGGKGEWEDGDGGAVAGRGGRAKSRPGDWTCTSCGAFPCFGRAAECFRCGAPKGCGGGRHGARGGGGGAGGGLSGAASRPTYLGPVGAGGSRPLLGGRGGGQQPPAAATSRQPPPQPPVGVSPTHRRPGSSVAAKAEQGGCPQQGGRGAPPSGSAAGHQGECQPVLGGQAKATARGPASLGGQPTYADKVVSPNSWAALAEEEDDDDMGGGAPAGADSVDPALTVGDGDHGHPAHDDDFDDEDGGQGGDHDAETQEADANALKREWLAHVSACRLLEKDGRHVPHQLLAEARAQRDAAEGRWRAAKVPHPLHKRLRWAESELREAESKEQARRDELAAHLSETAKRTRDIEARLEVDAARTLRKREALSALHREGAAGSARPDMDNAARVAACGIATDVAPSLLAAIEKLGTPGSEEQEAARRELQLVAVALGRVESVLREGAERAAPSTGPETYDIGDGDGGGGYHDGGGHDRHNDHDAHGDDDGGGNQHSRAAEAPRWVKGPSGPWRRGGSSRAAAEEARRMVRQRTGATDVAETTNDGAGSNLDRGGWQSLAKAAANTNDLAVAERLRSEAAQRQWEEVQGLQQQQRDAHLLLQEDAMRKQREQRRVEELQRHQEEMQRATVQRQAEEARQREELIASMSPEQLALAAEVHAQQAAIGTKVFGSPEAAAAAAAAATVASQAAANGQESNADADRLMEMSAEEYAQWNRDTQQQW